MKVLLLVLMINGIALITAKPVANQEASLLDSILALQQDEDGKVQEGGYGRVLMQMEFEDPTIVQDDEDDDNTEKIVMQMEGDEHDPTLQQDDDEGGTIDDDPDEDDHVLQEEDGGDGAAVLLQDEEDVGKLLMQMIDEEPGIDEAEIQQEDGSSTNADPDADDHALQEDHGGDGLAVLLQDDDGLAKLENIVHNSLAAQGSSKKAKEQWFHFVLHHIFRHAARHLFRHAVRHIGRRISHHFHHHHHHHYNKKN